MRNRASDALLKCGMPCNIKGFQYIVHAMELFDNGWSNKKTMDLYEKIAIDNGTTVTRVERAIRHALEIVFIKGKLSEVEKYFDLNNQKNGASLACLYYRLKIEAEVSNA